jgi:hypothetical protein
MDILILAAGLASRLSKFTHDIIPKYLVNMDDNTGLYYLINYWSKYSNNIYLVIHSKFNIITQFYINNILYDYADKIKIINYDTSDGTAYTLNYILNNNLKDYNINNLLITWCDLYPTESINFDELQKDGENNIFVFTNGNQCRYKFDENNHIMKCKEENDGNIVGIYYFQNYKGFALDETSFNKDIVEYLEIIGNVHQYELNNITDYGDEEKLMSLIRISDDGKLKCRYFNSIEVIGDDKLLKKGVNDKGKEIIKFEKEWYEYVNKLSNNIDIPKIFNIYEFGYLMEYKINHIPIYKYFSKFYGNNNDNDNDNDNYNDNNHKNNILEKIVYKLQKIHKLEKKSVSKVLFFSDLKKEIYDKIIERKKIITPFINYFGEISYVNNVKIDTFENILNKCKNIIINYYETLGNYQYSIIVGDCQFSNIIIDKDNSDDILFIDPRGYFGTSKIHGLSDYDYAKILYGISGYDKFNSEYFNIINIDINQQCINFDIDKIEFDSKIINKYFNKIHYAFLVIIWLSLAEYTKNNIWKCLSAYYYGLYLGTLLFTETATGVC